jgi:hypothetical protein
MELVAQLAGLGAVLLGLRSQVGDDRTQLFHLFLELLNCFYQ